MLEPSAVIRAKYARNGLGNAEAISYQWEPGQWEHGRDDMAALSDRFLRGVGIQKVSKGDVIALGSLRLRVVDYDFSCRSYTVMLDGWRAVLWRYLTPLLYWLEMVKSRTILTACVWGLGSCDTYSIPQWSNIYAIKAIVKWRNGNHANSS